MEKLKMRLLYDEDEIRRRVKEVAREIAAGYTDDEPILAAR